jgi:hypothetical protein
MSYKARILELAAGGTNAALVADNGGVLYSTASAVAILASTSTGNQVLLSGASNSPGWSTATYLGATTVNRILYSSANNVIAEITTGNNGVLITSATGVPSILAAGVTGQVLTATTGSPPSWSANGTGDVVGPASSTDNALVRFDGTTGKLIKNGVITEDNTGNLSISAAVSGASLSATVANTSNTASATAFYNAQVAGSTAADAYYKAEISGGQAWTLGLDNSDSDAFVISATATPGTTNVMRVSTAGEINYPLQPAFLGVLGTNDANVTGNGASYTLGSGNALTEVFDQNGDFVTTGTFTAPVTGKYFIAANFVMGDVTAAMTFQALSLVTSNRTYQFAVINSFATATLAVAPGVIASSGSALADMDAGDTFTAAFSVSGGPGNTVDTVVSGARLFICGNLVC